MKYTPLFLLASVFLFSGCSLFTETQPPAVKTTKVTAKKNSAKTVPNRVAPQSAKKSTTSSTKTYAIDTAPANFKDETSAPAAQVQSTPSTEQSPSSAASPMLAPPSPVDIPATHIELEDAAIPSGTPPAVVALISDSDRSRNNGDLDTAVVDMERALRIDARNPTITYKLAQLRLKQSKPQLAEELARKSALLAGNNLDLKRKSWLLIAEARQQRHDLQGAREAKRKAESFFGH